MKFINIKNISKYMRNFIDLSCDFKYGIKTCGDQEFDRRMINFGYKPTPYRKLKKIFRKYKFSQNSHLVDYGCGKGRVLFVAAINGCKKITGIEINSDMYDTAKFNFHRFQKKYKNLDSDIQIINMDATQYQIENSADVFFFFNPFHIKVLIKVLDKIKNSVIDNPRHIKIFFFNSKESVIWTIEKMKFFSSVEKSEKDNYVVYSYK